MFRKYFSSLAKTFGFMVCFGLLMGCIFPFYSAFFFGSKAFNPFYIAGCLTAGLLVGCFCYFCIKQALRFYLERQLAALSQTVGGDEIAIAIRSGGDELQALMNCNERLIIRVLEMIKTLSSMTGEIVPLYQKLKNDAHAVTAANDVQVTKSRAALLAVEGTRGSLRQMLADIEQIANRSGNQVAISAQMKAAIDTMADNMRDFIASVHETSTSIEEVLSSVEATAVNVEGLACSTEQTASSIHEISKSISQVRDHVNRTATCSEDVQQRASEGMEAMAATLQAMQEIEQSSNTSFASISRLAVQSERVGQILAVIHDVVEQTNLLSLNASIIAAQAGERGKSFAVVAGEVRSLAHRTAHSAGEIEELVKNIQTETARVHKNVIIGKDKATEGVRVATLASGSLGKIGESSAEVLEMVRKIVAATYEEASGSQLISEAAENNLNRVHQVTRAIKEQSLKSSQIVATLRRMRELSEMTTTTIQEQVRSNHLYMQGVLKDNDNIRKLRETAIAEGDAAGVVVDFVQETGSLTETNADKAREIMADIESIAHLTLRLNEEMAAFRTQKD